MSRDFFLLIDAAVPAQAVREDLVNGHGFVPDGDGWLVMCFSRSRGSLTRPLSLRLCREDCSQPTLTMPLSVRSLLSRRVCYEASPATTP
jgi:hypothetical protein